MPELQALCLPGADVDDVFRRDPVASQTKMDVQKAEGRRHALARHAAARSTRRAATTSSSMFLSGAVTKHGDKGALIMRAEGVNI